MIKTVIFDLDGTLLPMDAQAFERAYITSITQSVSDMVEPEKLGRALWSAAHVMVKDNDPTRINKDVYYEAFEKALDIPNFEELEPRLDAYYESDYDVVETVTKISKEMVESIRYLKDKGYEIILATNPMFPQLATDKRIRWAGLDPSDFKYITRFESSHFCKPNLNYYHEIVKICELNPHQCLMIGNDVEEDLIAKQLGMEVWLLEDNIIHRGSDILCDWRGDRKALLTHLKEVL